MPYNNNNNGCGECGTFAEIVCVCRDCRGNRLSGSEYELCKCGKPIDRKRTNSRGECRFCNLVPGEYTVKEVEAPGGCYPCHDRVTCLVRCRCHCSFENCKKSSKLKVYDDSGLLSCCEDFDMAETDYGNDYGCGCEYRG